VWNPLFLNASPNAGNGFLRREAADGIAQAIPSGHHPWQRLMRQ
jgi:hypothetical protein